MEKIKVLLISTKENIGKKIETIKNILFDNKKFEILVFTNKKLDNFQQDYINYFDLPKQELQNTALNNVTDCVIMLDLDYKEKTIVNNLLSILENFEENDIVNFKVKENKFKEILNKLKYIVYNFILSLFNISLLLNINSDFQYLSKNVTKLMSNISKSPNYLRQFDNFNGFNVKTVEFEKEKIKNKRDNKFLVLALILFSMAIISIALSIILTIKFKTSPNVTRMWLAEMFILILLIISGTGSLVYSKYINSI